ncbi:MAG: TetR/AcrR family transcriptional regulator [Pseudomonadota bacterium]
MPAIGKHKGPIVDAAIRRFRRQGYPGTGLNQIVRSSGAPKGSVYHYFPDGKPSIAAAAVEEAGRRMAATMRGLAASSDSADSFIRAFAETLGGWMKKSRYSDGCPLTSVLLELAPKDRRVTKAGQRAYSQRLAVIEEVLERDGIGGRTGDRLACLCLSALNGALIQARVDRSTRPLEIVAETLGGMLAAVPRL